MKWSGGDCGFRRFIGTADFFPLSEKNWLGVSLKSDSRFDALQYGDCGCGNASQYRKRSGSRQQSLHIEGYRNVATHLWPCDQEDSDTSPPSSHLDDVAGPVEANRRGRRY